MVSSSQAGTTRNASGGRMTGGAAAAAAEGAQGWQREREVERTRTRRHGSGGRWAVTCVGPLPRRYDNARTVLGGEGGEPSGDRAAVVAVAVGETDIVLVPPSPSLLRRLLMGEGGAAG